MKRNPYYLYDDDKKKTTPVIDKILDEIVKKCSPILQEEAEKIEELDKLGVGVGDTQTDECIADILGKKLAESFYWEIHK